jgi:hypothetical protein
MVGHGSNALVGSLRDLELSVSVGASVMSQGYPPGLFVHVA